MQRILLALIQAWYWGPMAIHGHRVCRLYIGPTALEGVFSHALQVGFPHTLEAFEWARQGLCSLQMLMVEAHGLGFGSVGDSLCQDCDPRIDLGIRAPRR